MFAKKVTMSYSNMPGPSKPFNFNDCTCNSLSVFLPAFDEQLCGITAWSVGNVLKVGLMSDYHYIEDPDEFMSIFESKMSNFLN